MIENSRFKFRVWIIAPITRDVEEEKEVSFYIYDIAIYDDGGIGFSRDSLLNALDKLNLTEGQRNEIEDYISDNSYSEDWEWYAISFDRIEQCTGLKDKNGKLIYEGDIVRLTGVNKTTYDYAIKWDNGCYFLMEAVSKYASTRPLSQIYLMPKEMYEEGLEVIGNIHTENINDM